MSGSGSRRRTRPSSRRYRSAELVPVKRRRRGAIGMVEISASVGVSLAALALIVLIWVVSFRNINEQNTEVRDRMERMVTAQAITLAEQIRLELSIVDQSLSILQESWNRDQEHFDLLDWQKRIPALTKVALDIFIADEKRLVRQDILPQAIGQGVGGAYLNFPHGTLEFVSEQGQLTRNGQLIITDSGGVVETRRYLLYIVRPLASPTNWLIGASYRTDDLVKLYSTVAIGINGFVALMDSKRGTLQAIAGPAARRPQTDFSKSEMLKAFNAKASGVWTGQTAMDGVARIHGYAKVVERDMIVTVGIAEAEAMAGADSLAAGAWWVAFAGSVLVVAIAGLILWEIFNLRANQRRQRTYMRMQTDLESSQSEIVATRDRFATVSGQVTTLMRISPDGLALLDPDLNVTTWNQRFESGIGVPPEVLRAGLPVDELFRQQAHAGSLGSANNEDPETLETEIAHRVALLRTEPAGAVLPRVGNDGRQATIHADIVPDGAGLVLVLKETDI